MNEITAANFCAQCSQKTNTKRISLVHCFAELFGTVLQTERGFLKTVIDLCLRPVLMINSYISGKRANYLPASKFTLFAVFIFAFLFEVDIRSIESNIKFQQALSAIEHTTAKENQGLDNSALKFTASTPLQTVSPSNINVNVDAKADRDNNIDITIAGRHLVIPKEKLPAFIKNLLPHLQLAFAKYFQLMLILWIPIITIASFVFYKKNWNLAEHLTIHAYLFSISIIAIAVITRSLVYFFPENSYSIAYFIFVCIYSFYLVVYLKLISVRNYKHVLRGLFVFSSGTVVFCISTVWIIALIALEAVEKVQF